MLIVVNVDSPDTSRARRIGFARPLCVPLSPAKDWTSAGRAYLIKIHNHLTGDHADCPVIHTFLTPAGSLIARKQNSR